MKRRVQTPATKLKRAKYETARLTKQLGEVQAELRKTITTKEKLKKIIKDEITIQSNCKETEYYPAKTIVRRLADAVITSELF